jgi:hypothetical protein
MRASIEPNEKEPMESACVRGFRAPGGAVSVQVSVGVRSLIGIPFPNPGRSRKLHYEK